MLGAHDVAYLLIGGYAIGYHGYPPATGDVDIWIPRDEATAQKMADVLRAFGFAANESAPGLFLEKNTIIRVGLPPYRIEVSNFIHGVEFWDCLARGLEVTLDGLPVRVISLDDLKKNKRLRSAKRPGRPRASPLSPPRTCLVSAPACWYCHRCGPKGRSGARTATDAGREGRS